jgi:hypothetical protein
MPHRAVARSRRRGAVSLRAHDWELEPSIWGGAQLSREFDACRYDDLLRPALRVRATLVLDDNGEPASLTDMIADRSLS